MLMIIDYLNIFDSIVLFYAIAISVTICPVLFALATNSLKMPVALISGNGPSILFLSNSFSTLKPTFSLTTKFISLNLIN